MKHETVLVDGHKVRKYYFKWCAWAIKALKRDSFQCRECGSDESIIVHHLDESRKNGVKNMNNKLDNLKTLCRRCHADIHNIDLKYAKLNVSIIIELRNQGKTFEFIGNHMGVSRQRIHQIFKKIKETV